MFVVFILWWCMDMKKEYYGFDILKFILSLLVVQIHIGFFNTYSLELEDLFGNFISRFAVPLFFIMSSYLLFNKINKDNIFSKDNRLIYINYFKRLILMYLFWGGVYLFCFKFIFDFKIDLVSFLFNFFFVGFYRQFWFLVAQIFGTFLLLVMLKKFSLRQVLIFSILLYIIGLILVPYNSIFEGFLGIIPKYNGERYIARNFLTFGLVFISLGAYISFYNGKFNLGKIKFYTICFLFLSLFEFLFLKSINCQYFGLQLFIGIVSVFIIVLLILKRKKRNK